jgi:hypothetical protein
MKPRKFVIAKSEQYPLVAKVIEKMTDLPVEVIVQDFVPLRTLPQNKRLWALHALAADLIGCTPDDVHEDMLCKLYGWQDVKMPSGDVRRVALKRSSGMNKKEFREFLDNVENFYASELGVWLGKDE